MNVEWRLPPDVKAYATNRVHADSNKEVLGESQLLGVNRLMADVARQL